MEWQQWLKYDESSPSGLRWATSPVKSRVGKAAGGTDGSIRGGYYRVKVQGRLVMAHRIVWEMHNGPIPDGGEIDHIDGSKTNNQIGNLRLVDRGTNCRNKRVQTTNKSGHTGVCISTNGHKRVYAIATWYANGKQSAKRFSIHDLGEEAAVALAIKHRAAMIEKLNQTGAGYTDRHGT